MPSFGRPTKAQPTAAQFQALLSRPPGAAPAAPQPPPTPVAGYWSDPSRTDIAVGSTGNPGLDMVNMMSPTVGAGAAGQQHMFGRVQGQAGRMGIGMPPPPPPRRR